MVSHFAHSTKKAFCMLIKFKIIGIFILVYSIAAAQNTAIGQWRIHLPFNSSSSVTEAGSRIYCAGRNGGLFFLDKKDEHLETITKISGLSDNKINVLRANKDNTLVVAYDNANIDLLKDNQIVNLADIKRKNILGKKAINAIHFYGDFCYLSCSFGIVVIDLIKNEVHDTYIIGPDGKNIEVFDFCDDGTNFYAATEMGLFTASVTNQNLANFSEWKQEPNSNTSSYTFVKAFSGNLYAYDTNIKKLYWRNSGNWSVFDTTGNGDVSRMQVLNNKLIVTKTHGVQIYSAPGTPDLVSIRSRDYIYANDGLIDRDGIVWMAVEYGGLLKSQSTDNLVFLYPNGPASSSVFHMVAGEHDLYVSPGGISGGGSNLYKHGELYHYNNTEWSRIDQDSVSGLKDVYDIVSVTLDPKNEKHLFISCFNPGLMEYTIGGPFIRYTETNSSLQLAVTAKLEASAGTVRIAGSAFDSNNNLWVSNSEVAKPLCVKLTDNTWRSFDLGEDTRAIPMRAILVDKNDNKWMLSPNRGIYVFSDNHTIDNVSDDKVLHLTDRPGSGNLPSLSANCMVSDDDGAVWVGTEKGIAVFYNPASVFNGKPDGQPVYLQQDGHTQILLETESVSAIAIDGGNRKWIGTKNSGVYLMSSDGTKGISHFDINNSPLLSNGITSIAVNPKSGEVFFGTDAGIISYKGTATQGEEVFNAVYAYPNPVREDYNGVIAIKGLVKNVNVKIADISGHLVYETKAIGGQAIWDGKNFMGLRPESGVYTVFCTNDDGTQTFMTKILFMK
jgi:hypothetical protein